jgi:hypothetical protein
MYLSVARCAAVVGKGRRTGGAPAAWMAAAVQLAWRVRILAPIVCRHGSSSPPAVAVCPSARYWLQRTPDMAWHDNRWASARRRAVGRLALARTRPSLPREPAGASPPLLDPHSARRRPCPHAATQRAAATGGRRAPPPLPARAPLHLARTRTAGTWRLSFFSR